MEGDAKEKLARLRELEERARKMGVSPAFLEEFGRAIGALAAFQVAPAPAPFIAPPEEGGDDE